MSDAVRHLARRVSLGSAAFALADLIVGCTVFGIASLAILTGFAAGWLMLAREYAARALHFGTPAQFGSAVGLLVLCPVFAVLVAWLGFQAFALPRRLWRLAATGTEQGGAAPADPPWPSVPMSDGALWAVRARRPASDYRFVSLLVSAA